MIRLVSLNIERSKHLKRIIPFIRAQAPDVFCVQELMERDIPLLEESWGMRCVYAPMTFHPAEGESGFMGAGIFSKLPVKNSNAEYYVGSSGNVREEEERTVPDNRPVLFCDVEHDDGVIRIATTHFTWTPDGEANESQRSDMKGLLDVLSKAGEFVLSGDFNAPRGKEMFGMLAEAYTDNIPAHFSTSLDPSLHRAAPLAYMVDGLFSTPAYVVADVRLVDGLSDHMAIVASVGRA